MRAAYTKRFIVAPLGEAHLAEVHNAAIAANMAQKSFNFDVHDDVIHFNENKYVLSNGGLDLDKAVKNLLRRKHFKELASNELILITSKPYSDPSLSEDTEVIEFLHNEPEMKRFLRDITNLVDQSVEKYLKRKFTNLMISFGCTGGQHRSVYCAEVMAKHLKDKFDIKLVLRHLELEMKQ